MYLYVYCLLLACIIFCVKSVIRSVEMNGIVKTPLGLDWGGGGGADKSDYSCEHRL